MKELHIFGSKICDTCRKKLIKESQDVTELILSDPDPHSPPSSQATESDSLFSHASEAASSLNMDLGEGRHLSYVVISECLHHDTVAVHLFQQSFIAFLKDLLPARLHPRNIVYFSDGAASQDINRKKFLNLCHHKDDFRVKAEWHFSATSHGKGACDGLGGTFN